MIGAALTIGEWRETRHAYPSSTGPGASCRKMRGDRCCVRARPGWPRGRTGPRQRAGRDRRGRRAGPRVRLGRGRPADLARLAQLGVPSWPARARQRGAAARRAADPAGNLRRPAARADPARAQAGARAPGRGLLGRGSCRWCRNRGAPGCEFVHEVWAPSRFAAAALSSIVPNGAGGALSGRDPAADAVQLGPAPISGCPQDAVVTLVCFNLASSFERKNPLGRHRGAPRGVRGPDRPDPAAARDSTRIISRLTSRDCARRATAERAHRDRALWRARTRMR